MRKENVFNPICSKCERRMKRNGYLKTKKHIRRRFRCSHCGYNYTEKAEFSLKTVSKPKAKKKNRHLSLGLDKVVSSFSQSDSQYLSSSRVSLVVSSNKRHTFSASKTKKEVKSQNEKHN